MPRLLPHKDPISYYFPLGGDVSVVQKTRDDDHSRGYVQVETTGEIRLRRLPKGSDNQAGKGYATAIINVSDPDINVEWTLEGDSRFLTITTPRFARLDSSIHHCVSLDIVVWVPEDAKLTSLAISAITLGLTVLDDIKLDVDESVLKSISGHVSFPTPSSSATPNLPISHPEFDFGSRKITIQTVSGDINGLFPLLDSLKISSKSGNVDVSVQPHDALPSRPVPANLNISTTSGDMDVRLPLLSTHKPKFTPPPRDYVTSVTSASGDISGTFYIGSSTSFETVSGTLKMKALPILQYGEDPDKDPKAVFLVETLSGDSDIDILDPMFISAAMPAQRDAPAPYPPIGDQDPYHLLPGSGQLFSHVRTALSAEKMLRSLRSTHTSTSGGISIRCPPAWEGSVSGHTVSGVVSLEGKDLNIIRSKKGYSSWGFLARKGVDSGEVGSSTTVETISGDVRFSVESH